MFRDAKLKVERAKHHISDLECRTATFLSSDTFLEVVDDRKARRRHLRVKKSRPMPAEFSLIFGDAIHNLRSALDLMTWEVVSAYRTRSSQIQFPVGRNASDFEDSLRKRQVTHAKSEVVQKFRDLRVYPGGNNNLYDLHLLDVLDKHRLIILFTNLLSIMNLDLHQIDDSLPRMGVVVRDSIMGIEDGGSLAAWPLSGITTLARANRRLRQNRNFDATFVAGFRAERWAPPKLAIPALNKMTSGVEEAINNIESAFT